MHWNCVHYILHLLYISLPARTSIIAAANPVGGHYNKAKTVSENLRMNSALLSRFDLVFILLDKPDEEMDGILSEHVMSLHSEKKRYCFLLVCTSFSLYVLVSVRTGYNLNLSLKHQAIRRKGCCSGQSRIYERMLMANANSEFA